MILISQLSFSQTEKDDYEIYAIILSDRLELTNGLKKEKIVLIEQLMEEFDGSYHVFDHKNDTITKSDLSLLYSMTFKDTTFIKRVVKDKNLKNVIIQLTSDKTNHPKIKSELLEKPSIEIETITKKKFNTHFRNFRLINRGWKGIMKKYKTDKFVEFSQVNYHKQYASVYYANSCGGLCGSGNIVVFENIDGEWKIITEINLWMA